MQKVHSDDRELAIRQSHSPWPFLAVLLLASAIDITAFYFLDRINLTQPARIGAALLPLPGNLALLLMVLRRIRRLDEFQKHVQLEAVAVGFLATGVAVFIYGYLQKAHAVGPLNMGLVWIFMVVFYGVGYFAAVSHYK
jgi:O-antigen/teichoic acid export membrane protein